MTKKLIEFIRLNQTIKTIIDDKSLSLEPLFQFRLLGILKKLEPHITNFEIIRNEKIREYGTASEDGALSIPASDTEAMEKFNAAISQVLDGEITVDIEPFAAADVFEQGINAECLLGLYEIMEQ